MLSFLNKAFSWVEMKLLMRRSIWSFHNAPQHLTVVHAGEWGGEFKLCLAEVGDLNRKYQGFAAVNSSLLEVRYFHGRWFCLKWQPKKIGWGIWTQVFPPAGGEIRTNLSLQVQMPGEWEKGKFEASNWSTQIRLCRASKNSRGLS